MADKKPDLIIQISPHGMASDYGMDKYRQSQILPTDLEGMRHPEMNPELMRNTGFGAITMPKDSANQPLNYVSPFDYIREAELKENGL